jgi:tRNA-(ms[2]io[6]A)-hydroxylase
MVPSSPDEDNEGEDRPPWHWSWAGAIAIFLVWLPLAALINTPVARLLRGGAPADGAAEVAGAPARVRIIMVGVNVLAFLVASLAGGFLVGRFGGRAGKREAAVSGLIAAVIAWASALMQASGSAILIWALLLVFVAALGMGGAYVGGRVGLARRKPSHSGRTQSP